MLIAGWDKFQGYKKRGPDWIKLHLGLLDQPQYLGLPCVCRAVLPALWLTAARISEKGELPDDLSMLSILSHVAMDELRAALPVLVSTGFIECAEIVAVCAPKLSGEERRGEERERESRATVAPVASLPQTTCLPPEQRAEEATNATIRRLQLELGSWIARLAEHANSRQMVPAWSREVTSYTRTDGTTVKGVPDYRTVSSIDRLEKSIEDAKWWWEEMESGKVVGEAVLSGAR